MKVSHLLQPALLRTGAHAADAEGAIRLLVDLVADAGLLKDPAIVRDLVLEREGEYPTGIGSGVAVPHCSCLELEESLVALAAFPDGVNFGAPDGPARLVFLLLSPPGNSGAHLKLLARISRLARHDICTRLAACHSPEALIAGVAAAEQDFLEL